MPIFFINSLVELSTRSLRVVNLDPECIVKLKSSVRFPDNYVTTKFVSYPTEPFMYIN